MNVNTPELSPDLEILARSRYPTGPGSKGPEIVMEFPPWSGKLAIPAGMAPRIWAVKWRRRFRLRSPLAIQNFRRE